MEQGGDQGHVLPGNRGVQLEESVGGESPWCYRQHYFPSQLLLLSFVLYHKKNGTCETYSLFHHQCHCSEHLTRVSKFAETPHFQEHRMQASKFKSEIGWLHLWCRKSILHWDCCKKQARSQGRHYKNQSTCNTFPGYIYPTTLWKSYGKYLLPLCRYGIWRSKKVISLKSQLWWATNVIFLLPNSGSLHFQYLPFSSWLDSGSAHKWPSSDGILGRGNSWAEHTLTIPSYIVLLAV